MPLNEHEREWLERRGNACTRCGIKECGIRKGNNRVKKCDFFEIKSIGSKTGMLDENFSDAAEFEARVAEKLSDCSMESLLPCKGNKECLCAHPLKYCTWCRMKYARLATEEEMEFSK